MKIFTMHMIFANFPDKQGIRMVHRVNGKIFGIKKYENGIPVIAFTDNRRVVVYGKYHKRGLAAGSRLMTGSNKKEPGQKEQKAGEYPHNFKINRIRPLYL